MTTISLSGGDEADDPREKSCLIKMPDDNDDRTAQWQEIMLNGAILCGLLDKPADAKDWLRAVLAHFPDDQTAKEILSAIR